MRPAAVVIPILLTPLGQPVVVVAAAQLWLLLQLLTPPSVTAFVTRRFRTLRSVEAVASPLSPTRLRSAAVAMPLLLTPLGHGLVATPLSMSGFAVATSQLL